MRCARCGNTDPRYFHKDRGTWYCRRCAGFSRLDVGDRPAGKPLPRPVWQGQVHLEFPLTELQKKVSREARVALCAGQDVFVYAAAGAGKTEMTLESIDWFLKKGRRVCFAISRRQVVLEIADRLKQNFPGLRVVPVCQGHTRITEGDLIVCTTHQLYRYPKTFDLLILDEMDAYPYANNQILQKLAEDACIGVKLMLSATPDKQILQSVSMGKVKMLTLFKRPHGHLLPVPETKFGPVFLQIFWCIRAIGRFAGKQVLVFVPRRKDVLWVRLLLGLFFGCKGVHSQTENRDRILQEFREGNFQVLVSTTLLERGITIGSVQVIVLMGDHPVFTCASLVQIFGRAGRKFTDPKGECLCFGRKSAPALQECITQLKHMNQSACTVGN